MAYQKKFTGQNLDYIGFPLGGIGAGMFNVEGNGSFSAFSLRNAPNVNLNPLVFSALTVKGEKNISRVIEGQVPHYKIFGGGLAPLPKKSANSLTKANGLEGTCFGLARFKNATFEAKFPFAHVDFEDEKMPLKVALKAWSPFTPPHADDSSYPVAYLEYTFTNETDKVQEAVYYYSSMNFMTTDISKTVVGVGIGSGTASVYKEGNGFVFSQEEFNDEPWQKGAYLASIDDDNTKVNTALFRGGWFDTLTMLWNDIEAGKSEEKIRVEESDAPNPGASLSVAFTLQPGESKTIVVNCSWYVPDSHLRFGQVGETCCCKNDCTEKVNYYKPWYTSKFNSVEEVNAFSLKNRERLHTLSKKFTDTFYASTISDSVLEAVSANLTILKSPTILRQTDGRLWCWEGCCDAEGCCAGSCTHVWNYAQAICHLFPELERGMRETEFFDSQNEEGHQAFRAALPIAQTNHDFHAASDGQLGGILKVYRDFLISGDIEFLKHMFKRMRSSIAYCIFKWDKKQEGVLKEPHHNTYDIEFWGADGMCTSFYLAALTAMIKVCDILKEDSSLYQRILNNGIQYMEEHLYNGEYFFQQVEWETLEAELPKVDELSLNGQMSKEAAEMMKIHGPKYQYGTGCISDGVLGFWMSEMFGLSSVMKKDMVLSHLNSVYKYNVRENMYEHSNPQRPGYAMGKDGGLLLCSWPHGNKPALPFVYSDEVWTGIEYQVASHLIMMGELEKGLHIVELCRARYQGDVRNPFDEYECGHWYARALASYSLLQAVSGAFYNAYEKTLTLAPKIKGDFSVFICTNTGFGLTGMKDGKPFVDVVEGTIDVQNIKVN